MYFRTNVHDYMYVFLVEKYHLQFLLKFLFMVDDLTSSVRRNYYMDFYIFFIHCSQSTAVHVQVDSFVWDGLRYFIVALPEPSI